MSRRQLRVYVRYLSCPSAFQVQPCLNNIQAVLMATAALTLHWDGVRRDLSSHPFFPCIHLCMSHANVGVRYAACQCARALCRSVSVLRTSVVDSGLGNTLFDIIKTPKEDRRVQVAALAGICNILNDFSPMRVVRMSYARNKISGVNSFFYRRSYSNRELFQQLSN